MKKNKKLITILIITVSLLVLVAAGLIFARKLFSKSSSNNTTYRVKKETYSNTIDIAGVVAAAHQQTLQALASGTVIDVYVSKGDHVKKGDVIIQLDDTTQVYNLAKHDYDMATKRISGSQKELELMETERLALVQKIAERKVTATFDGIIADIKVSVGDSLDAKDSVGTLVDLSYLTADVEIAETDVAKLSPGQPVNFTFPAYDGIVNGYVVDWPAIGSVTSRGATVVKARLRIDDYPSCILPNFSFSGEIQISPDETYILVSKYAVAQENKTAYVVDARTGQKIEVKVSPYNSEYYKVEEGLSGGEVLVGQNTPTASGSNRNRNANGGSFGGAPGGGFGAPQRGF